MAEMKKLLEDIKNNRCILFLGPLMTVARYKGKRMSMGERFSDHILDKLRTSGGIAHAEQASRNSYYLMTKYIKHVGGRTNFDREFDTIKSQFFNPVSSIYRFLSHIPFNTIVNFGSDHLMEDSLTKAGYEFYPAYYNYQGDKQNTLPDLDDKVQLVYNLLGSIYKSNSQVLTEADQIEFLKQIVSDRKLPNDLLARIKEDKDGPKSYIFLGFNFEEWPFRFLLDILQVPKSDRSGAPKIPGYNIAVMTEDFYQERFGLTFFDESPENFALNLIKDYAKTAGTVQHKNGFLSFHDNEVDTPIVQEFKDYLEPSGLGRRIKFWDSTRLIAGDHVEAVSAQTLAAASIYIPFISIKFINDPVLQKELNFMLSRPNTLIFPIIVKTCPYKTRFPALERQSTLILPGVDDALMTFNKTPTDKDYNRMISKINSAIR